MSKYIFATILSLFGILLLLPMTASAAVGDVIFSEDTNIYLTDTTPALTLTITGGSRVDAMAVYPTYVSFDMLVGSVVTLRSADRKILTANPAVATGVCGTTFSYITLQPTSAQTVTVTPGITCAVVTPPGGGAAPPAAAAAPPTPPASTSGEGTVTASEGGEVSATITEGGGATAEVPANAVVANTAVTVTPTATTATAVATAAAAVPSGQSVVGNFVYNFAATAAGEAVTTFAEAITLTFTYTDAQVTGLNESTLIVNRWDAAASEWVALTSTVNTATNTVTATTTHFSYFAIIGEEEEEEEEVTCSEITDAVECVTAGCSWDAVAETCSAVGEEEEEEEEEEKKPVSEMTIAELKAEITRIAGLIADLQAQLIELFGVTTGTLTTNLEYDDSGDDVELLQTWLAKDAEVYPEAIVSGWFGSLTKAAVILFQNKYADEVLAPWNLTAGTGYVGSTTRDKLNALYAGE